MHRAQGSTGKRGGQETSHGVHRVQQDHGGDPLIPVPGIEAGGHMDGHRRPRGVTDEGPGPRCADATCLRDPHIHGTRHGKGHFRQPPCIVHRARRAERRDIGTDDRVARIGEETGEPGEVSARTRESVLQPDPTPALSSGCRGCRGGPQRADPAAGRQVKGEDHLRLRTEHGHSLPPPGCAGGPGTRE